MCLAGPGFVAPVMVLHLSEGRQNGPTAYICGGGSLDLHIMGFTRSDGAEPAAEDRY